MMAHLFRKMRRIGTSETQTDREISEEVSRSARKVSMTDSDRLAKDSYSISAMNWRLTAPT
jgi:flavin-binding protein dodecin